MTNREKVIKGLDLCLSGESSACNDCPYDVECKEAISVGQSPLRRDALNLLKEHGALPIIYQTNEYTGLPMARCPSCGEALVQFRSGVDGKESKFCYYCGQEVEWNDKEGDS